MCVKEQRTTWIIGGGRQCVRVRQRESNWWEGARWSVAVGCVYVCVAFILKQNIWGAVTQLWVEKLLQYFITAARSGIKSWEFSLSLSLSLQSSRPQMPPMISVCVRRQTLRLYIERQFSCFPHLLHPLSAATLRMRSDVKRTGAGWAISLPHLQIRSNAVQLHTVN